MTHFTTSRPAPNLPFDAQPPEPAKSSSGSWLRTTVEWVVILGVAILGAFLIRTFLVQAFWIPSGSMEPTLKVYDRVLVNKTSYRVHSVNRGDIVVFLTPPDAKLGDPKIKDLIKRVIALPGETIEMHNGQMTINGQRVREPYLPTGASPGPDVPRMVVPPGDYFVMGDNRSNSEDSRFFGPIPQKLIVGRAFVLVWPVGNIHLL